MIIFVISMSTPWQMMKSLNKWSNLIRNHLNSLNIDQQKLINLQELIRISYQNYQEPDELLINQNINNKTIETVALKIRTNSNDNDNLSIPLDSSVLTHNLGIPCLVIVTKVRYTLYISINLFLKFNKIMFKE